MQSQLTFLVNYQDLSSGIDKVLNWQFGDILLYVFSKDRELVVLLDYF